MSPFKVVLEGEPMELAAFAGQEPSWVSDAAALRDLVRLPSGMALPPRPRGDTSETPVLAPWREGMLATAVLCQPLRLGHPDKVVEARPDRSFGHGRVAFLAEPVWPACKQCETPLELCFQLAPGDLGPWLHAKGSLVAMFCFRCLPGSPETVFLSVVTPSFRVERPAGPTRSSSHTSTTTTRSVGALPVRWQVPPAMAMRYLLDRHGLWETGAGAAGVLLAREDEGIEVVDEVEDYTLDMLEEYSAWAEAVNGVTSQSCGSLGGYTAWDQADETPECTACGALMEHLLDWNGEQFLDGALHVFVCDRTAACGGTLEFVAEF
ncbi:hypothetical protein [Chondromyces apiculatus]|uniref:hypothetical protein n=1 Tax=Chondromyces apiculatus TaxID=51 RepID=UPI0005C48BCE|nr:hypothetical protein [Chondromyces apiculatus]